MNEQQDQYLAEPVFVQKVCGARYRKFERCEGVGSQMKRRWDLKFVLKTHSKSQGARP